MSEGNGKPAAGAKGIAKSFVKDERGDFGIGQIAAIVAAVVIIGVIISVVTGFLPDWIEQLWTWITELFDSARNGI